MLNLSPKLCYLLIIESEKLSGPLREPDTIHYCKSKEKTIPELSLLLPETMPESPGWYFFFQYKKYRIIIDNTFKWHLRNRPEGKKKQTKKTSALIFTSRSIKGVTCCTNIHRALNKNSSTQISNGISLWMEIKLTCHVNKDNK